MKWLLTILLFASAKCFCQQHLPDYIDNYDHVDYPEIHFGTEGTGECNDEDDADPIPMYGEEPDGDEDQEENSVEK